MLFSAFSPVVRAGGSGLNVLVVANARSSNSLALANYYCERRHVPPQNVLRIENWTGGNIAWSRGQFDDALLRPLLEQLSVRRIDHQIDFVLLSMDIPYQVSEAGSVNSTTSVLFYGFKPDAAPAKVIPSCGLPDFSANSYAFSEADFRESPPNVAPAHSFLAMMLTATNLDQAKFTVDQGVKSDGTLPNAPVYLVTTSDRTRSVRSVLFDDAVFDVRVEGSANLVRVSQDSPDGDPHLLGYQTGLAQVTLPPYMFVPGAMADSLTSFGGDIIAPNFQTTLLAFLAAGASGSYGTVIEPCDFFEKFPSPRNYFYQARGFSLAESYYQSVSYPYLGLLVGEPLAEPFARCASGSWDSLPPRAVLHGITPLALHFNAADSNRPLQQIDLFLDGCFIQTVTNIPPSPGNLLSVTLNGSPAQYTVPESATLSSVAAGLAGAINAISNATQVTASAVGDRVALHSKDPNRPGSAVSLAASASVPGGIVGTTFLKASAGSFLDSLAAARGSFEIPRTLTSPGDYLQLEIIHTNGHRVTIASTNSSSMGNPINLARDLAERVNGSLWLQQSNGLTAQLLPSTNPTSAASLVLEARQPGFGPSQIQGILRAVADNSPVSAVTNRLETNLSEIEPRAHLYVAAGVTNPAVAFPFDTTAFSDGHHELTAVAYEGSHVRTQTAVTQSIIISNSPLAAAISTQADLTNVDVESTLVFSISASRNATAFELFSTGGSLGVISNQITATFSVPGDHLGAGLHPFYAIVTGNGGAQYRTETKWIRLASQPSAFLLTISGYPPSLSWPAVTGRQYDVLSADSLTNSFQMRQSITVTNTAGHWREDSPGGAHRFYRIRSS